MIRQSDVKPDGDSPVAMPLQPQIVDATDLLGDNNQVLIRLRDQFYTLRKTRQGKLLLTK